MRPAYIIGTGIISPQATWAADKLADPRSYAGNRLTCIEPDYTQWLDAKQLRRMSRLMKMGAAGARLALQRASLAMPDAIITGTGLGCLEDTGSFLEKMIERNEDALNPTPFIQSTHNTIGSHIAFLLQCLADNQTYSHGAFSFESALLDGLLHLTENESSKILVGAADEITDHSHSIISRFGILKQNNSSNLDIFKSKNKGTIHGEGSAWFVLAGEPDAVSVKVEGAACFYRPENMRAEVLRFISEHHVTSTDVDLVLSGKSGDGKHDDEMDGVISGALPSSAVGVFKHLCGEYFTASSFALWLAYSVLKNNSVPPIVCDGGLKSPLKKILIYNRYLQDHHSLMLVTKE